MQISVWVMRVLTVVYRHHSWQESAQSVDHQLTWQNHPSCLQKLQPPHVLSQENSHAGDIGQTYLQGKVIC